MHIVIAGSGPVGMTAAVLLARQGHRITIVDRDPGPRPGRPWDRVGVMQFHLPHGFRSQCRQLLLTRLPDVHQAILDAGAILATPVGAPESAAMLQVRRSVLERVLWDRTSAEPGIERLTGHVDGVEVEGDRVVGVIVDSAFVPAGLVVDATGRSGRISSPYRPLGQRVDSGMAYASRQYRLRPGAAPGPVNGGPGYLVSHRGFLIMVFRHDGGFFTVLFVRPSVDRTLAQLRLADVFEAACTAIPALAEWTDPRRAEPVEAVRAGANLINQFRGQPQSVTGLVAIGDAFCMTNPQGARGVSLGMQGAAELADRVADLPLAELPAALDSWGMINLWPWFRDHVAWDQALAASWAGRPLDVDGPIGLETLFSAAHERHPEWLVTLGLFVGMAVTPAALEPLRAGARELLRAGWQPQPAPEPTRDQLAALIADRLRGRTRVAEPLPA